MPLSVTISRFCLSCANAFLLLALASGIFIQAEAQTSGQTSVRQNGRTSVQTNAQPGAQTRPTRAALKSPIPAARTAQMLEAAKANPLDLEAFLVRMPKGGDLHNHLGGAIYAETWIRDGNEDHLCVDMASLSFTKPQTPVSDATAAQIACGNGAVPAALAYKDQHLYDSLIDAFSMRGFVPTPGVTAHDHFFDAFAKFSGLSRRHMGEWLDELATRAAAQNEQYIELMDTPPFVHAATLGRQTGWNENFAEFRQKLLDAGIKDEIRLATADMDAAESLRNQLEHCGQKDATPACRVEIRYIYQILRGYPKQQVFAQTLLGFETAAADPRFVGLNYVQQEDSYTSMTDYGAQMQIVAFMHKTYPNVHIALHAGELAPGLVPYEGLCCHIRLAVEVAQAERIGHGVDVMQEDRPLDLLKEMAARHVMVEINLTSNDVILGVRGKDDPLPIYRKYGVPVALSTDDEGVSRIDMTREFVRAVESYDLRYSDLKQMVRTSMEHAFLPGASLWSKPDEFGSAVGACSQETLGAEKPSAKCEAFLAASEKARQQWGLEKRFREFEAAN